MYLLSHKILRIYGSLKYMKFILVLHQIGKKSLAEQIMTQFITNMI